MRERKYHRSVNIATTPPAPPHRVFVLFGFRNRPQGDDGSIYTGTADGLVYRLDPDGGNPTAVFFTGGVVSAAGRAVGSTTGVDYENRLRHECHEKVSRPGSPYLVCFCFRDNRFVQESVPSTKEAGPQVSECRGQTVGVGTAVLRFCFLFFLLEALRRPCVVATPPRTPRIRG